jgi:hypothetical protein
MKKLALLLLMLLPLFSLQCMIAPRDGQEVGTVEDTVTWTGYFPGSPGAEVRFIALNDENPPKEVATIGTTTLGTDVVKEEVDPKDATKKVQWYGFSSKDLPIPLDIWANHFIKGEAHPRLRVRALVGTTPLATFQMDGATLADGSTVKDCLGAQTSGQAVINSCGAKIAGTSTNKNYADLITSDSYIGLICLGPYLRCKEEAGYLYLPQSSGYAEMLARCTNNETACLQNCDNKYQACLMQGSAQMSVMECNVAKVACQNSQAQP